MIYFDNAATGGRKPDGVISAVHAAAKLCANPGRSGHSLSLACARVVQNCRTALSDYFDGYGAERVIFTKNCTEAINIALFGTLKAGDHVVTNCMEHNSVLRPLERLKRLGLIEYDVCPTTDGNISPETLAALVKPNTRLVAVTSASNVTGTIPPLEKIRKALPEHILFLVDGAQGAGHYPLHLKTLGADFLAVAGHKGLHGIQGSGALLFSERIDPTPLLYGGTGSESYSLEMPSFYPDALEAGTLSFPAVASLAEGVFFLIAQGDRIEKQLVDYTAYLCAAFRYLPDFRLYSAPNPCGIVAFSHRTLPSEEVANRLNEEFSIAVRGGFHCAPLMHRALGTAENGLVRASFSPFNREKEIDVLVRALKRF